MMPNIVNDLASTVKDIELGNVTVFDGGDGNGIAGAAMGRAKVLAESLATLESVLGVDLRQLSQKLAANVTPETDGKKPAVTAK